MECTIIVYRACLAPNTKNNARQFVSAFLQPNKTECPICFYSAFLARLNETNARELLTEPSCPSQTEQDARTNYFDATKWEREGEEMDRGLLRDTIAANS